MGYALCTHLHYRAAARDCGPPIDRHVEQGDITSNEVSDRHKAVHHAHSGTIPVSYSDVSVIFFYPLWSNVIHILCFIFIRFAFTGIMVYIAWDSYVNPQHKDRVDAFTSKVNFCTLALFYPSRVWQISHHLFIWIFAGIPGTTRLPIDVYAPSGDGSRGISIGQTLPSWHCTGSHSSNSRKFFTLCSLFCSLIIWWFLFFVGICHSQRLWHAVAMEREPHAFWEKIEQPVMGCSALSQSHYKFVVSNVL